MSERKFKPRNHNILRSTQLDDFILGEWDELAPFEKMKINEGLGKVHNMHTHIQSYSLDKKLLMLTYMNKKFCVLVWDDKRGADFFHFQKIFNYYLSEKQNFLSDEVRRTLNVFCINERMVAKHYFAGTYRFAEPLYRMVEENGTLTPVKFMSQFRTPASAISQGERTERNFSVYALLGKMLTKGYYLDDILLPFKLDFGHYLILQNLFNTEKPLSKDEVLNSKNILNRKTRTDPTNQRLNYLVEMQYVERHNFAEKDEDTGEEKKIEVFTISSKGIHTWIDIINVIMK